jgi:hypothetical protein
MVLQGDIRASRTAVVGYEVEGPRARKAAAKKASRTKKAAGRKR